MHHILTFSPVAWKAALTTADPMRFPVGTEPTTRDMEKAARDKRSAYMAACTDNGATCTTAADNNVELILWQANGGVALTAYEASGSHSA